MCKLFPRPQSKLGEGALRKRAQGTSITQLCFWCLSTLVASSYIEDHAQRDGDIETMAIRALHKAKLQQLRVSDLQPAQGETLE